MGLPWYKFYVNDWQRSETRASMTLAERGLYRELLDIANTVGSIPKNPRVLAGLSQSEPKEFNKCWPRVSQMFESDPENPDRLINGKAADVFAACGSYLEAQRVNGSKGGRKKKHRQTHGESHGKPMGSDSLKRASTKKDTDTDTEERENPPTPLDWSPWPDAEAAREAILDAYPSKSDQYGARLYWRQFLDDAQHLAPAQARAMHAAATLIADRIRPEKVEYLISARKFVEGRWSDPWEKITASWGKPEEESEFEKTMKALAEARRTA